MILKFPHLDGQVLLILLKLDPDSLLNCGMASSRLFRLVSDWEVWAHLLNGVPEFSQERLDQLVQFKIDGSTRFGIVCKPEMMMAVAKEVAIRCQQNTEDAKGRVKDQVNSVNPWRREFWKLTLSLDNMEAPHTLDMTWDSYKQEFARVAAVVEAKFTIRKLDFFTTNEETLRMLVAQVDQQKRTSLSMVKMGLLDTNMTWEYVELSLKLIKASKDWVIKKVAVTDIHELAPLGSPGLSKMIFAELRKCSATGHVGQLRLIHGEEEQWLIKEDVRAVWEISENVEIFTLDQLEEDHLFGGVSAKDTNVTWEEAYELLKMIC